MEKETLAADYYTWKICKPYDNVTHGCYFLGCNRIYKEVVVRKGKRLFSYFATLLINQL